MKIFNFLLLLILFTPILSFGQLHTDNSGYLITAKGDTIYGKFRACNDWTGCELKKFKTKDGEKINAKKMKVVAYYHAGDFFVFRAIPPLYNRVYLKEIIIEGYVFYEYTHFVQNLSGTSYSNNNMYNGSQESRTDYYMVRDGSMVRVRKGNLNKFN